MRRFSNWFRLALCVSMVIGLECGAEERTGTTPQWIDVRQAAKGETISKSFRVSSIQSATLQFAGEFCRTRIAFNGKAVADIGPYCPTRTFDITNWLRVGENKIEFFPEPNPGDPAALAATLSIVQVGGEALSLSTDSTWLAQSAKEPTKSERTVNSKGTVSAELWGLGRRGIAIDPFENYEQWQQAKNGQGTSPRFFVAQGFEINELRVAASDEGSWVSLAVDSAGRITIAREDQGFLRFSLSEDGKSITQTEAIPSDLLECRGLAYQEGWLYASANNSKKLYRLKIDDRGAVNDVRELRELPGGVGHGRNDLNVDTTELQLICGDSVDPVTTDVIDHTSPLRKKVAGSFKNEGCVLRTTPNGDRWELLCAGLRNPYGIAKHPHDKDAFTYDADNEYDLGMPWYRPTRVLQLVPGADFGYREATRAIPPRFADQPDNCPPLLDIGRGSPTAVMFGDKLNFPSPYREALFILDWTYGRVIAVHLAPRGATYRAATELFLQGRPLNVTDIAAGKDGAMYLITGGRKTQSALYRITATRSPATGESQVSEFELEARNHAQSSRDLVRRLQSTPTVVARTEFDVIASYLDHNDPVVRYSASVALERLENGTSGEKLFGSTTSRPSFRALLSAARRMDARHTGEIVERLSSLSLSEASIGERLVWLRTLELCMGASAEAVKLHRERLESSLLAGWEASREPHWQISREGTNVDYRRRAAILLGALESASLPAMAGRDLLTSSVQEDRVTGLMALRNHRIGFSLENREAQLDALASMPDMEAGEGLPDFHAWLERETLATLTPDEKQTYLNRVAKRNQPEPIPPSRAFVKKWQLDDFASIDASGGDPRRGEAVFRDALCARCHRFGTGGPAIGPDLTFVAGRFSQRDILDSIFNPSKSVAENYRSITIETTEGRTVTGRLASGGDFRSEKIRLIPDLLRATSVVEVDKKLVESHRVSELSPMPQGLLDSFTERDITDLLAYLVGRREAAR